MMTDDNELFGFNQPQPAPVPSGAATPPIEPHPSLLSTPPAPQYAGFPPSPQQSPQPTIVQSNSVNPVVKRKYGTAFIVSVAVVAAVIGGGISGTVVALVNPSHAGTTTVISNTGKTGVQTVNTIASSDLSKTIQPKLKSVVTVGVTDSNEKGTGAGIVLNAQGYIVTNAHVATLEGATASGVISIQTSTGGIYPAKLVAYDANADLAVIKVDPSLVSLTPITFASSSDIEVGDTVVAVGAPLGLSGTVTEGIVSALNRPITVASSQVGGSASQTQSGVALSVIQTDAAINPGNSGGALLDANGNLIGINVAIASANAATSGSTVQSGSIGVGFAIPSDYVKRIAQELIATGKGEHGLFGANVTDYSKTGAAFTSGAQVRSVTSGGASATAGLIAGDVVTKVDSTVIESATQLTALIKQDAPGQSVSVTYTRSGVSKTVTLTLGTAS